MDYSKDKKTSPLESKPTIIEILGFSGSILTEFVCLCYLHFRRRKSDIANQVSSILIIVFFSKSISMNLRANYCLMILLFGEFSVQLTGVTFLKLIFRSWRRTCLTI